MDQDPIFIIEHLKIFAVVCASLTGIFLFLSKIKRWVVSRWEKRKAYVKKRNQIPCILEDIQSNIKKMDERVKRVEHEIKPNGGGSMKDALRIVKAEIEAAFWLNNYPSFRMTRKKGNTLVNESYCHLLGASSESLLKLGWKNFVCDKDELDVFVRRWNDAASLHSQFLGNLKFNNSDGTYIGEWVIKLRPLGLIPDEGDYLWHGTMIPHDQVAIDVAEDFNIPRI